MHLIAGALRRIATDCRDKYFRCQRAFKGRKVTKSVSKSHKDLLSQEGIDGRGKLYCRAKISKKQRKSGDLEDECR